MPRPYTCEVCGDEFSALWRMVSHRTTEHPGSYLSEEEKADPFARFERRAS